MTKVSNQRKTRNFLPSDLAVEALSALDKREAEVMRLRLGLTRAGERLTLEEIGKEFGITRERVRQIENKVVKELGRKPPKKLKQFFEKFREFMAEKGGLVNLGEAFSFFGWWPPREPPLLEESSLRLLLKLDPQISPLQALSAPGEGFYLPLLVSLSRIKEATTLLKEILERTQTPLPLDELAKRAALEPIFVKALLSTGGEFGQTRDERFGLKSWPEISPRRIRDKIYLVLKEAGHPLHFRQITQAIGDSGISKRPVLSRTVHNELIYDSRFILVGRGIYALREWGYQPGVVADVIAKVLKAAGQPLKVSEIIEEVLKERLVKRNTIVANLHQNKERFQKVGKALYRLAEGGEMVSRPAG